MGEDAEQLLRIIALSSVRSRIGVGDDDVVLNGGRDIGSSGFEACLVTILRVSAFRTAGPRDGPWHSGLGPVLARTGHLARAVEQAYAVADEEARGKALLTLVKHTVVAGRYAQAQALAESIPMPPFQAHGLVMVAEGWARAGSREKASALVEKIRFPHLRARALALMATAAADAGDYRRALALAARAEEASEDTPDLPAKADVLVTLMKVVGTAGDDIWAEALADRVEDFARSRWSGISQGDWVAQRVLAAVLASEARRGELTRLDALLGSSARSPLDAGTMAVVADSLAGSAGKELLVALADRAEHLLADRRNAFGLADLRSHVMRLLVRAGMPDRAETLSRSLDDPVLGMVEALAAGGDLRAAEETARSIGNPDRRERALLEIVSQSARMGDTDRAEAAAKQLGDTAAGSHAWAQVVEAYARKREFTRAEALARAIPHRSYQVRALVALAKVLPPREARRLAARAVCLEDWTAVRHLLDELAPSSVCALADAQPRRKSLRKRTWNASAIG
ncbi:hypothetical protein ABT033_28080 [Streptomyces pharetrae]|uniref:hypothetical protein n=1 Tax=Streptomyces pharetrae TaxID=291370 RepID=UPI00335E66E5